MKVKLLVLTAFSAEAETLVQHFAEAEVVTFAKRSCLHIHDEQVDLYIANTGVGAIAAANTTTALCEVLQPELIFICGTAGGLVPQQRTGDLIIGETIFDIDQYDLPEILNDTPFSEWLLDPHLQTPLTYSFSTATALLDICLQTSLSRIHKKRMVK